MFLLSLKVGIVTKVFMDSGVDRLELFFYGLTNGIDRNAFHAVWGCVTGLTIAAQTIHVCGDFRSQTIEIDFRCRGGAQKNDHPLTEG